MRDSAMQCDKRMGRKSGSFYQIHSRPAEEASGIARLYEVLYPALASLIVAAHQDG